ncbi:MAG: hypothetical protein AAGB11_06065 [Pseudomonadota bacterium]
MKAAALAAVLIVPAFGGALAQSFQTALPVSSSERQAIESRLSTILDYSGADEINRFDLHTGRTVTVRPYRAVRRTGQPPCRGYRIDLRGPGTLTAVDGFRCKRRDGRAWVIVEPELILAQEGPRVIPQEDAPRELARARTEPLYPADEPPQAIAPPQALTPPPVPRPAPRAERRTALAERVSPTERTPSAYPLPPLEQYEDAAPPTEAAPAPSSETAPAEPAADDSFASRVVAVIGTNNPPPDDPTPDLAEPTRDDVLPAAAPAESTAETVLARTPSTPDATAAETGTEPVVTARVVGESETPSAPDHSEHAGIVAALYDLEYLSTAVDPTPQAVEAAIDEFAIDERFALPVSADVLADRLDAAIERSETLPTCAAGGAGLCAEPVSQ